MPKKDAWVDRIFSLSCINKRQREIIKKLYNLEELSGLVWLLPDTNTNINSWGQLQQLPDLKHSYFFEDGSVLGFRAVIPWEYLQTTSIFPKFYAEHGLQPLVTNNWWTSNPELGLRGMAKPRFLFFDADVPSEDLRNQEQFGKHIVYVRGYTGKSLHSCGRIRELAHYLRDDPVKGAALS